MGGENSKMERNMKGHDHSRVRPWMLLVLVGERYVKRILRGHVRV